ncbi:MAG: MaoC/PaaZ C-terminal domain-containing protein [Alphaproteobacteria bacterium]
MASRFLEDFTLGEVIETASVILSHADIMDFGQRFDPQPIHTDAQASMDLVFGGLIASGFHTIAVAFGQFIRLGYFTECSLGGPAMDEVRWIAPVRPDMRLNICAEVIEVRHSRSKPDRGILRMIFTVSDDDNTTLATFKTVSMLRRRPR